MKHKSKYSYEEMVLTIRDILMKVFPVIYFDESGLGAKVYPSRVTAVLCAATA